ncbi:trans-aconitate 2-methyltransferase [uncultured Thiodictyon sp.]|uniref:class I SAM-dependent methyltransferase n=1 Tax=uncultured Thiodictyon sp. TaxID=1846217 RepID=UPI0025CC0120|nr:class I SAM-dependent methyltransferase [uncultured Thiodictyon sp.]
MQAVVTELNQCHRIGDVQFCMRIVGGPEIECSCRDFLHLRPEEEALLRGCLDGLRIVRTLDIGCGIGRHSALVQSLVPHAAITLVESDKQLRDYCAERIAGARVFEHFDDLPADSRFDLAILMGNGLGIFGTEDATLQALQRLHGLMAPEGSVLIESGSFTQDDFSSARHEIEYDGAVDGPFTWGYATRRWLQRSLDAVGFTGISVTPSNHSGTFYICHAKKL